MSAFQQFHQTVSYESWISNTFQLQGWRDISSWHIPEELQSDQDKSYRQVYLIFYTFSMGSGYLISGNLIVAEESNDETNCTTTKEILSSSIYNLWKAKMDM